MYAGSNWNSADHRRLEQHGGCSLVVNDCNLFDYALQHITITMTIIKIGNANMNSITGTIACPTCVPGLSPMVDLLKDVHLNQN